MGRGNKFTNHAYRNDGTCYGCVGLDDLGSGHNPLDVYDAVDLGRVAVIIVSAIRQARQGVDA